MFLISRLKNYQKTCSAVDIVKETDFSGEDRGYKKKRRHIFRRIFSLSFLLLQKN